MAEGHCAAEMSVRVGTHDAQFENNDAGMGYNFQCHGFSAAPYFGAPCGCRAVQPLDIWQGQFDAASGAAPWNAAEDFAGALGSRFSRVQRLDIDIEHAKTCDDLDVDHQGVVYGPMAQQPVDVEDMLPPLEMDGEIEAVQSDDKIFVSASRADGRLMQHNVSGVLHFVGLEDRFVCGRPITGLYCSIDCDLSNQWPICQQCRRIVGEDAICTYMDD